MSRWRVLVEVELEIEADGPAAAQAAAQHEVSKMQHQACFSPRAIQRTTLKKIEEKP